MKTTRKLIAIAVTTAAVMTVLDAVAQRNYNPKTVETVEGRVMSVEKMASPQGRGHGVHLALRTADNPSLDVRLGPDWYVDKQTPHIESNDVVIVTGSRVIIDGKPAIIAAVVKKGTEVLTLRDKSGVPAWSGKGRRSL